MNRGQSGTTDASSSDIYLQPHSDDICFSLGALACRRHRGTLLTVFPIAIYVALPPGAQAPSTEWVTKTRLAEDRAFAQACGLDNRMLELPGASGLGQPNFGHAWLAENIERVRAPLLEVLTAARLGEASRVRPWLFCPSGIGGHVDHVAVRQVVIQDYARLAQCYRIGFYEDLHYASSAAARSIGINNLLHALPGRTLHRHVFPLGDDAANKLALIHLYRSQFLAPPRSIDEFTPAVAPPAPPHEAVWSDEKEGPALAPRNVDLAAEPK
jgi:LmbE family N-acetylglucosaminyl deacetylase